MSKRNKLPLILSITTLGFFVLMGLFSGLLTGRGHLIPYTPTEIHLNDAVRLKPFISDHYLGTTILGRDIAAGIVTGANYSLTIGFFSALITLIIGIVLGIMSSLSWRVNYINRRLFWPAVVLSIPYAVVSTGLNTGVYADNLLDFTLAILSATCIFGILIFLFLMLGSVIGGKKTIPFKFNTSISLLIILLDSAPKLLLLVIFIGLLASGNIITLIITISLLSWIGVTRMIRVEIERQLKFSYADAAVSYGISVPRLIVKHILPHLYPTLIINFIYTFIGAIVSESTLSFLFAGQMGDNVTWGSIIGLSKDYPDDWWLLVVPSTCLVLLILSLFTVAKHFSDKAQIQNQYIK